jgi:hypothetical protein
MVVIVITMTMKMMCKEQRTTKFFVASFLYSIVVLQLHFKVKIKELFANDYVNIFLNVVVCMIILFKTSTMINDFMELSHSGVLS